MKRVWAKYTKFKPRAALSHDSALVIRVFNWCITIQIEHIKKTPDSTPGAK